MKISEIITDKYKLRIPPTVYYELLADVQEVEEEQEPTNKNFTKADIDAIVKAISAHWELIIDEIRAEIKKSSHGKWYVGRLDGKTEEVLLLDEVLQILDKYTAESEDQDGQTND